MRRRLTTYQAADQAGFTMVELLIAMALISIGMVAVLSSLDRASDRTLGAQAQEQTISYGQREVEKLRTFPYDQLGLSTLPAPGGDGLQSGDGQTNNPKNPNYYVSGTRFLIKSDYGDKTSGTPPDVSAAGELMVAGGTVAPGPETVDVGAIKVKIYRYVTWRNDPRCPDTTCPGDQDTKRITVAVVPDEAGSKPSAKLRPYYFSSVVVP
jgi:prepilin-type N-terminal cleavage/methylation domain-containing protein